MQEADVPQTSCYVERQDVLKSPKSWSFVVKQVLTGSCPGITGCPVVNERTSGPLSFGIENVFIKV